MTTSHEIESRILEAIDEVIERHHHAWTTSVLHLAEAYAWLRDPAQPHGAAPPTPR